ncbi:hypothetical protein SAMN05444354_105186 [Stigmatella aurantiaca]|uniref:Uncharacterized protein n=1 Tax=Stigmatella aurantiaca TaxID=41 RepID=A0A1H7P5S7_STIAU|nr:hypothetical protein [Stigmatella aurantiaca]SEL31132.1 hypothetical protein SAMN05444354_105186 [Stigmatella aurantiaca]
MTLSLSSSSQARGPWRRWGLWAAVLSTLAACGPAELPPASPALRQGAALSTPAQVSAEIPLSTSAAHLTNDNAVAASGDGLYLVVWREYAQGVPPVLLGARIRASDGAVLDASPLRLTSSSVSMEPSVAFDGTHFLVVWWDSAGLPFLRGVRVRASDGAISDVSIPRYGGSTFPNLTPVVAFDGTNYLVVWWGYAEHGGTIVSGLQGIRLRPSDGTPIESTPFFIPGGGSNPKLAYGDGHYLVTWTNGPVKGVRINTLGQVLDTVPLTLSTSNASKVQVASQGSSFLVVWTDSANALRATRVRAQDGARLDLSDLLLDASANASTSAPFAVTFDGMDYQVLWQSTRGGVQTLLNTRVSAAGATGAGTEVSVSAIHAPAPSDWVGIAAAAPGRFLTVYSQYAPVMGNRRPMARLVERVRASVSPMLPVGPAALSQHAPAAAVGAGRYLVVWAETDSSSPPNTHILAVRVDAATGAVLDSPPLRVSQSVGVPGDRREAAVAFAGENFLVVWTESAGNVPVIQGARVRASDGAVLDAPLLIGGLFSFAPDETPSVASDGTNFLVAWNGWSLEGGGPSWGVQLTRIGSADGQRVPGSNVFLAPGGLRPQAAYGNGRFFVAWHVYNQGTNAYGARLDAATGAVIDTSPLAIATTVAEEKLVAVTSSGSQFFVALRVGYSRVRALRIDGATGLLLDSPSLIVAESSATAPGVAFDGNGYRVAWQGPLDGAREVYSARVSTQGQLGVGEEYGFSSVPATSRVDAPAIAAEGPGRFLVAWSQNEGSANRVRIRLVNEVP